MQSFFSLLPKLSGLRIFIVFLSLFALSFIPSSNEWEIDIIRKISAYQSFVQSEKLFLQTDRPIYVAGEELWFSAFLVDAASHLPNKTESVLYVELIKPNGSIAAKELFKLDNGRANGTILINPKCQGGEYLLVAYTNWMRNLGSDFFYRKNISIVNDNDSTYSSVTSAMSVEMSGGALVPGGMVGDSSVLPQPDFSLKFFPEGGDLIQGVTAKLAFEGLHLNGSVAKFEGIIEDNNGNFVCSISPIWSGKGYLMLTPEAGRSYFAKVTGPDGKMHRIPLPEAKDEGFGLSVETMRQGAEFVLSVVKTSPVQNREPVFLLALQNGVPVAAFKDSLVNGVTNFNVPLVDLNSGIVQFTLFDANKVPRCERLVFVNKNDALQLTIKEAELPKGPRGKVVLDLFAANSQGVPVEGDFAVSVTDADRIPDEAYRSADIYQYLTLLSNIPNNIPKPSLFFSTTRQSRIMADLLMLTNGWRRYEWNKVMAEKIEAPKYLKEPGIYVQGRLLRKSSLKQAPAGMDVTMFSGSGKQFYNQKTDETGSFIFLLKDFNDTLNAVVQTKNRNDVNSDFVIELVSNMKSKPTDNISRFIIDQNDDEGSLRVASSESTTLTIEKGELKSELTRALNNDFYADSTAIAIEEVAVFAEKMKSDKEMITQRYGAPDYSLGKKSIDKLVKDRPWQNGLMSIIPDAFPGLYIDLRQQTFVKPPQSAEYIVLHSPSLGFRLSNKAPHRFFIFVDGEMVGATDDNGILTSMVNLHSIDELISLDPEVVEAIDLVFPKKDKDSKLLGSEALMGDTKRLAEESNGTAALAEALANTPSVVPVDESGEPLVPGFTPLYVPKAYTSPEAVLSIYTKNGGGIRSRTNYKGIVNVTVRGFSKTKEFYKPTYGADTKETVVSDKRNTLAWLPSVKTDSLGKAQIEFYTSDAANSFRVEINGIAENGLSGGVVHKIESPNFVVPLIGAVGVEAINEDDDGNAPNANANNNVLLPNGAPCAFALVASPNKKWATCTNRDGFFSIDTSIVKPADIVTVSKPGFKAFEVPLAQLVGKPLVLAVDEPLPSVDNMKDILRKVWSSKYNNRNPNQYFRNGVYRERVCEGQSLMRLTDFYFLQRWPSLGNVSTTVDTRLLTGRRFRTDDYVNTIGFEPQNRYNDAVPLIDPFYSKLSFTDRTFEKSYDFTLLGTVQFQGRQMYVVAFDQTDDTQFAFYSGKMYVDVLTYGIAWVQWKISDKAASVVMPDMYLGTGGDQKTFKLIFENNEMTYAYNNGFWEPMHGIADVGFTQKGVAKSYFREMVWMTPQKETNRYRGLKENEMKKRTMLLKTPAYNPSKWRMPWVLTADVFIDDQIKYLNEVTYYSEPEGE